MSNALKDFLSNPMAGVMQGVQLASMFGKVKRGNRQDELKQQELNETARRTDLAEAEFAAKDPVHDRMTKDAANSLALMSADNQQKQLAFNREKYANHGNEVQQDEETRAIYRDLGVDAIGVQRQPVHQGTINRLDYRGPLGSVIQGGGSREVMSQPDVRGQVMQRLQERKAREVQQRSRIAGSEAKARQTQMTEGHAARGHMDLINKMAAKHLGLTQGAELTESARLGGLTRLKTAVGRRDLEPAVANEIIKRYKLDMPRGQATQPGQAMQSQQPQQQMDFNSFLQTGDPEAIHDLVGDDGEGLDEDQLEILRQRGLWE